MGEGFSWSFSSKSSILVEQDVLRMFLEDIVRFFPRTTIVAKFSDGVELVRTVPRELIADVAKQDRKLVSIEVRGVSETVSPAPYARHGDIYLGIGGDPYWATQSARFNYADDRFFAIKNIIEQFYNSCRVWYAPFNERNSWFVAVPWLMGSVLLCLTLFKLIAVSASMMYGKGVFIAWIEGLDKFALVTIFSGLGLVSMFLVNVIENYIGSLFPASVILIGAEKKKYERLCDIRKWMLGLGATSIITSLLFVVPWKVG